MTKALGTLNLVSARGLDNGTAGALALANQESFSKILIKQTRNLEKIYSLK